MKGFKSAFSIFLGIVILQTIMLCFPDVAMKVNGTGEYLVFVFVTIPLIYCTTRHRPLLHRLSKKREYIVSGSGSIDKEFFIQDYPGYTLQERHGADRTYVNESFSLILTRMAFPPKERTQNANKENAYWLLLECLLVAHLGVLFLNVFRMILSGMPLPYHVLKKNMEPILSSAGEFRQRLTRFTPIPIMIVQRMHFVQWEPCLRHITENWHRFPIIVYVEKVFLGKR